MRAYASSLGAWRLMEDQEGTEGRHGLTFPLAMLEAIGRDHGLEMVPEESCSLAEAQADAVFISVLDSRCMVETAAHFRRWGLPLARRERGPGHPIVWAGGQGLWAPLPMAEVYDLCVVGDAEGPLPLLLDAWTPDRDAFLRAAADVPGVYVPSIHGPTLDGIERSVAQDITTSLRHDLSVNLDGTRRVEIARGCRFACRFCGLGSRIPYREVPGDEVIEAIRDCRRVHLQAGDAESHRDIRKIRAACSELGIIDQGWTGRLDTTAAKAATISGSKRYAFGVEALTERVRRSIGKPSITDERLVESTLAILERIEGSSPGRTAWHMIAGLPGEGLRDTRSFGRLVQEIDRRWRGPRRNLAIHWQPFQPLPGTPMQFEACGAGARRYARALGGLERLASLHVRHVTGRSDEMARVCTVLSRCDGRGGLALLDALGRGLCSGDDAARIGGASYGAIETAPWCE